MAGLTVTEIDLSMPGDVLKDAAVPGLQLRAFPGRRSWYLYYRTRSGVQRKPKLGDWPSMTIHNARKLAKEMLGVVAHGGDPSRSRQEERVAPTVADLAARYNAEHGSTKKGGYRDVMSFDQHILPVMGQMKVSDVTRSDVEDFMRRMKAKKAPVQGNRCLSLLSKAFNLAIGWGIRTTNPAAGVKRWPETARRRYLSADEFQRLGDALTAIEGRYPDGVAVIRLLMLTGARLSEITGAKREWVRGNTLYLPDSKTGVKEIALAPEAIAVIEQSTPLNGALVGRTSRPTKAWEKAVELAGLTDIRIHDLRHSFASAALSEGLSLAQIGELLGHKTTQTTKRYAHLAVDQRNSAAAAIAGRIAGHMKKDEP